ncbi:MAG: DUF2125 domain-containing protein [Proteobacteria bacterium]|nr:DUF2125 domain-containing protein [Pseudomonadota bacterium]
MKRWIRMSLAGTTLALFAWTVVWMLAARHVAERFELWREAQGRAGVTLGFDTFDVKGWPFGWRAVVEKPTASGSGAARWAWSGERLVASVDPRDLSTVAIRLPGAQRVQFGAGDLATVLAIRAARPEGTLRFDTAGRVEKLDLDLEALELRLDEAAEALQVRAFKFGLAPHRPENPTYRTDTLDVTLDARGIRLPAAIDALAALGRDIASAELDARVQGRIAGTKLAEAVTAWRDDGGTLEIGKLALAWGPLLLDGDGTLALDAANRPMGAATARIAGFVETIDALAGSGAIRPAVGAGLKIALTLMARQDPAVGNRPRVTIPMSAQDGAFSVERFRLFAIPPLALD